MNSVDADGNTPLIIAVKKSNASVARLLLENGADVGACSKEYKTALDFATQQNRKNIMKMIQRVEPKRTQAVDLQEK